MAAQCIRVIIRAAEIMHLKSKKNAFISRKLRKNEHLFSEKCNQNANSLYHVLEHSWMA